MKITLGKIVNNVATLRKMASQDLSLKTAYETYKLIKIMNEHLGYFDENRDKNCELADNQDKELEALLQTEVELADFQKVKVSLSVKIMIQSICHLLVLKRMQLSYHYFR